MTLPFPPRRSHLTAFWLGLHVAAFAVAGLLGLGLGAPRAALAVALLLTGSRLETDRGHGLRGAVAPLQSSPMVR